MPTDDQTNSWTQPHGKGKGRGKGTGFDAKQLWCDIHQQYGHSTDWCYKNPNRTNGAPPPPSDLCGVRRVTDKDTPPTIALPLLSKSPLKAKGRQGPLAIATGRAKISLQPTTQTRLLPPYMTSHHPLNRYGGRITNWDPC